MKKRTKKTLAVAGKVLLRIVLATVLCAILYFSMLTIATGVFSDVNGYQVYDVTTEKSENFYFADGASPEDKPESTNDIIVTDLREVSDETLATFQVISQVMMLIVLAIFPYHILWEFGNQDDTKVRYKGQQLDVLRGYRVGAFASVPYLVLWVLLVLTKFGIMPDGYVLVYRLATFAFWPFVNWMTANGNLQACSIWQLLALLVTAVYITVVCGVSYQLGHKQFSIHEHLVFSKKADEEETEM